MENEHSSPLSPPEPEKKALEGLRTSRMVIPIVLGLAAVAVLMYYRFDREAVRSIQWDTRAWLWILVSFLLLLIRHLFYSFRLRALTGGIFPFKKYLEMIVLWEFSAALTPTSKGGPFVMLFALPKEGLNAGRATAAVLYTIVLDAGFFVLTLPIMLWFFGAGMIFPEATGKGLAHSVFYTTYTFMFIYWVSFVFFLFFGPKVFSRLMHWLAGFKFLKKQSDGLKKLGEDFIIASKELKNSHWSMFAVAIGCTVGAWTTKFLMINALMLAVAPSLTVDGYEQAFIFGRLIAMFIVLAFSFTPGGAGLAELGLVAFIEDRIPAGLAPVVAVLWRGMAYYGYLIVGAFVVPRWLAHIRKKKE